MPTLFNTEHLQCTAGSIDLFFANMELEIILGLLSCNQNVMFRKRTVALPTRAQSIVIEMASYSIHDLHFKPEQL